MRPWFFFFFFSFWRNLIFNCQKRQWNIISQFLSHFVTFFIFITFFKGAKWKKKKVFCLCNICTRGFHVYILQFFFSTFLSYQTYSDLWAAVYLHLYGKSWMWHHFSSTGTAQSNNSCSALSWCTVFNVRSCLGFIIVRTFTYYGMVQTSEALISEKHTPVCLLFPLPVCFFTSLLELRLFAQAFSYSA